VQTHPNSLANLKMWEKGKSGNPGGLPRTGPRMTEMARQYGPEAINMLVEKMRHGEDDRVQIMAAKILLDRGYGAVKQIEDGAEKRPPPTPEERIAILHEIAARLGYEFRPLIKG